MPFTDIPERRHGLAALGYRHKAARVEGAARGRVKGTGHFTLQDDTFTRLLDDRVGNRHGGKKRAGIGVEGIFIKHA